MTRIQHLMTAWFHLTQAGGLELAVRQIELAIAEIYNADTENLEGRELVDRLTDEELAAAIRLREPRLKLYEGSMIDPFMFNYIRKNRSAVAAAEFSRRA